MVSFSIIIGLNRGLALSSSYNILVDIIRKGIVSKAER